MMVHDHQAHVTRTPTWACVCAHVAGGRSCKGSLGDFRAGLGGTGPALWDVRGFRRGNEPRREGLRLSQEI